MLSTLRFFKVSTKQCFFFWECNSFRADHLQTSCCVLSHSGPFAASLLTRTNWMLRLRDVICCHGNDARAESWAHRFDWEMVASVESVHIPHYVARMILHKPDTHSNCAGGGSNHSVSTIIQISNQKLHWKLLYEKYCKMIFFITYKNI